MLASFNLPIDLRCYACGSSIIESSLKRALLHFWSVLANVST